MDVYQTHTTCKEKGPRSIYTNVHNSLSHLVYISAIQTDVYIKNTQDCFSSPTPISFLKSKNSRRDRGEEKQRESFGGN